LAAAAVASAVVGTYAGLNAQLIVVAAVLVAPPLFERQPAGENGEPQDSDGAGEAADVAGEGSDEAASGGAAG
jgi:hypothetical protein